MSQQPDVREDAESVDLPPPRRDHGEGAKAASPFEVLNIDDAPDLLEQSYALRYEVYCLERDFLQAADYPNALETDQFDEHSLHFGALDAAGGLAGTARIVQPGPNGLPLFHYCTLFDDGELRRDDYRVVEISRIVISRQFRRRRGDILPAPAVRTDAAVSERRRERRRGRDMIVCIIDAMYQACRRMGVTHTLAGMDYPLQRVLSTYGFDFKQIGPEVDYFGRVAPFVLDLRGFQPSQHICREP